jgi:hypothetical protein
MPSHNLWIGSWRKRDGLTFEIKFNENRELTIHYSSSSTNTVEILDDGSLNFHWKDLHRPWGPTKFSFLNKNTIQEMPAGAQFKRIKSNISHLLSLDQLLYFQEHGFLILRGAVSALLIKHARRAILCDLGSHGLPPHEIPSYSAQTFVPELRKDPARCQPLVDCFTMSPLLSVVHALLGDIKMVFHKSGLYISTCI